jgi:hypothetical protein
MKNLKAVFEAVKAGAKGFKGIALIVGGSVVALAVVAYTLTRKGEMSEDEFANLTAGDEAVKEAQGN